MMDTYNAIIDRNNEIGGEYYELNDRAMNAIAARIYIFGLDSVSVMQKIELEILANTCPFVGGSAVFKARPLWAMFQPNAQYNDRLICLQGMGQGKQSNNNENIDSLYEVQAYNDALSLLNGFYPLHHEIVIAKKNITHGENIILYPNPAHDYVNIEYTTKQDGLFILYDYFGQELVKKKLYK
jgi:hypothetical protein